MRDTLRAHKSTTYSEVRYSPSPLYTLGNTIYYELLLPLYCFTIITTVQK